MVIPETTIRFKTYKKDSSGNLDLDKDKQEVTHLHEQFCNELFGFSDGAPERLRKELGPQGRTLGIVVAFADDRPIGYASLKTSVDDPEGKKGIGSLSEAFVDPAYRRRGFYEAAVDQRVALARGLGLRQVEATLVGDGYRRHMNVLEKKGFRRVVNTQKRMVLDL